MEDSLYFNICHKDSFTSIWRWWQRDDMQTVSGREKPEMEQYKLTSVLGTTAKATHGTRVCHFNSCVRKISSPPPSHSSPPTLTLSPLPLPPPPHLLPPPPSLLLSFRDRVSLIQLDSLETQVILLLQSPEGWDYRCVPVYNCIFLNQPYSIYNI